MEPPFWGADCKVVFRFLTVRGSAPLAPALFKGQVYSSAELWQYQIKYLVQKIFEDPFNIFSERIYVPKTWKKAYILMSVLKNNRV